MTNEQKEMVSSLRDSGMGYGSIARQVGVSENTVKSFCRRHAGMPARSYEEIQNEHKCLYCGTPVKQNPGRKEKKFCSDKCRNKWWNAHLDLVNRRATREVICANCGKAFPVYGNAPRKYCCHECYVEHRFGGRSND